MKESDVLKLENQLCFSIYAASRAITKIYRPFLDELGITYPQYLVMLVIWENNSITLKELGNKLYLDSGTLTPLLKRLERMELIRRERSTEDERLLCVSVTEKGLAMKAQAISIPECILGCIPTDIKGLVHLKKEIDKLLMDLKEQA
ncbi:MarR family winged helix-turn-helix transcriptional regulator [Cellulosilyticum sp. I15G10I2]|uniref:MarR family winged helix-turn-helix transcriptional regulator n=1 Tax=Cellulosilyticum sp. I15G10I2 TaxID=1892843 RepID=UPI00085C4288|nr:MarR family transcriptional regulator [Cellulosilyticum sp. I15G10I2]